MSLYLHQIHFDASKARSMALKMIDVSAQKRSCRPPRPPSPWRRKASPLSAAVACRGDAGGYMGTSSGSGLIDLSVEFLNGEGCRLKLEGSCTGREVYRMVSARLPKKGGQPKLYNGSSPLILHKALQEQGIVSGDASLSCTYVPTNLYAAWRTVQGFQDSEGEIALEGVTWIKGATTTEYLRHLPQTLAHLTFGSDSYQSLKGVTLPRSLQSLSFGDQFNQCLKEVTLPHSLQSLSFGFSFNQSLEAVTLPHSLQSLSFGYLFNQSLEEVALPNSLQSLSFGQL